MFCPNCGANIPGNSEVCPECGTEIFVSRHSGDNEQDPFIVAEDMDDVHTSSRQPMPENDENGSRPGIIEAEDEDLPEETGDDRQSAPDDKPDLYIQPEEGLLPVGFGAGQERTTDIPVIPDADRGDTGTGEKNRPSEDVLPRDGFPHPEPPSGVFQNTKGSGKKEPGSRSEKPPSYIDLPSPSRRRPMIAGLAVMIFVVLGIAILIYGIPGEGAPDTGVPIMTALPTAVPDTTPVPVTVTPPPWTPSENLQLSISAYGSGYKVEIDSGLKEKDVEKIVLTVEDDGGLHTMEWVYPSRHETFYMARDAYNGTASATEHVTATATYSDRKKEIVFSGNL